MSPVPAPLEQAMARALGSHDWIVSPRDPRLPLTAGAYALAFEIEQPVEFRHPRLGSARFGGWLVYAGSARGSGGLRARLGRHLQRCEQGARLRGQEGGAVRAARGHWHIDRLTGSAVRWGALVFPAPAATRAGVMEPQGECALVARMLASGDFAVPLTGFGSSDCRVCPAHLLRWRVA